MPIESTAAEVSRTSASGISTALDTGSSERGSGILAHAGTSAHLEFIAEINAEHRLAAGCAKEAVQHAIRCGYLLTEQKSRLPHGEFSKWIETNCEFAYSTAARYMAAAKQISTGVEIPTLSALFPSGRKTTKKMNSTDEMATAADAETAEKPITRRPPAPTALMTGAPSVRSQPREVMISKAISALARACRGDSLRQKLCKQQADVRMLRKALEHAETKVWKTEEEVLEEHRKLKAKEARE